MRPVLNAVTPDAGLPASPSLRTSLPHPGLDSLCRLAQRILDVALALVIRDTGENCASTAPATDLSPPELAHLAKRIGLSRQPIFATDLLEASPLAGSGALLFCAGYPLQGQDGTYLGALCLFDRHRHELTPEQRETLADLASSAAALLDSKAGAQAVPGEAEDRMALAISGSGTGIWDRDLSSDRIHYSAGWKAMLGYADHEVSNRIEDSYGRVHPDELAYVQATMQAHFAGQTESYEVEHRLRCRDGSYKWVCSRGRVVSRSTDGRALRMIGTTTDISATRALAERLRDTAELLTHLTDEVPGLVFQYQLTLDGRTSFTYASAGIHDIYEVTPAQIAEDSEVIHRLIHPDDLPAYQASRARSASEQVPWHIEYRTLLPRQGLCWRQIDARPKREADGSVVWHGVVTDITERKRIEAELLEFATTDALTQLLNRRVFMEQIEAELMRIRRSHISSCVLMCDLDHFKRINDKWGHAIGDLALKHFCQLLCSQLRKTDIAGRIGGEEFAVVLNGANMAQAREFAQRMRQSLEHTALNTVGATIRMTLSIGISQLHAHDSCADAALSRSDAALYRAKKNGRNRIEVEEAPQPDTDHTAAPMLNA